MTREQTPIDKLIDPAVVKVAKDTKSYFRKSEVVAEVTSNARVATVLKEVRSKYGGWKLDQLLLRYISDQVGRVLQQHDANGIRVYECYAAQEKERRWMPLRAMTADHLRAVMQETRTQARSLELKGTGYQYFMEELEKLNKNATVDEVYERAVPKIQTYRARAS